jgi:orotate phosphoribosyltransferase
VTQEDIVKLQDAIQLCFKYEGGPFRLASGRLSEYYYNGKGRTLHPPTALLIGNILLDVITDSGAEAVGGCASGSIPISDGVGMAAHLRGRVLPTFYVRREKKGHGTEEQIEQALSDSGGEVLVRGRKVALVDDVLTTGGSIQDALDVLQEIGCIVSLVVVLVERHESGGTALRDQGFPVMSVFRTDEKGSLSIDQEFARRTEEAARSGVLSR